ncbi:hypothetical protein HD806DRAFT_531033 [Xylariaceae sp. AK1471]|nr:hypothetical protein HD806DRAFT_531033 [Xylariaceae sp. AK1471]
MERAQHPQRPLPDDAEDWESVEIQVEAHGFEKLGLMERRVPTQLATKSAVCGHTVAKALAKLISATAGDFLGKSSHLRASGHASNLTLRLIPQIAVMRPSTLTAIKRRLFTRDVNMGSNYRTLNMGMSDAQQQWMAHRREDQWRNGGPWLVDDTLITWHGEVLPDVSLTGVSWRFVKGVTARRQPYDRVVTFDILDLPAHPPNALSDAHDPFRQDYVTWDQFLVFSMWWAHYIVFPEQHESFEQIMPAADMINLMDFTKQMPIVLRDKEENGLAFYAHLGQATRERHRSESSRRRRRRTLLHKSESMKTKAVLMLTPADKSGWSDEEYSRIQSTK